MSKITVINPSTEQFCGEYLEFSEDEVNKIIEQSHQDYLKWSRTDFAFRKKLLLNLAKILRSKQEECATKITTEMGKVISESKSEIEKCAVLCEFYAKNGVDFLKPEHIDTEFLKSYRSYQPLGLIFAVMPWNFPFWQVMRFAIPNLAAGNGAILKHASQTMGCALLIEKLFVEAGFPNNIFRSLVISSDAVSKVIHHQHIKGVTLTGSESTGEKIAAESGKALKKVVMELGGSDPYLILEDANLEHAAEICLKSRLLNSGQVCIAAKRIIVVKSIQNEFESLILKQIENYKTGNPILESTNIGPMVSEKGRTTLHSQVQKSVAAGAVCALGGKIPEGLGYYYPPTLLTNVSENCVAFCEELFGPVVTIITAEDEAHAIELANKSLYGLGAAIFTQDIEKGEKIAATELEAGFCAVNNMVASDPRLPFGGIKRSGFGRELSKEGMHEFMNIKTITVAKGFCCNEF